MTGLASCRLAVIGGGLAGITAAVRCADAGAAVTLYEARPRLGGLTSSFRRGELWVDNGQHVFLRCCTSYRALVQRLGAEHMTALQPRLDIAVRSPSRAARLRRTRLPAPLHLAASLARYPWLNLGDRVRFARAALALRAVDAADPATDLRGFGDWLREHGQSASAVHCLWELVGIATLNARADDASLALAATVFQIGMLRDNCSGDIGWSAVPLQRLHGDTAADTLAKSGAAVQLRTPVRSLSRSNGAWDVEADTGSARFDAVIAAVPPSGAEALLPEGAVDMEPGWSQRLGSSPIINLHLILDRTVLQEPFIAAVDSDVQWVFDRTDQSGLPSGQYLAVSLSAADDLIDVPTATLRDRFVPALKSILPGLESAELKDFFVTREREATFRPSPGTARLRPPARTAVPGLYLAGAWTATEWPATMEGAVRSGDAAAAALLADARSLSTEAV
ncbi:hydroxysqualene dehydroxylase HpnE [Mycobacterium rhizamassiliense]|uniref:hydroxysqualene dehydroxylase HpnE n=1 Tax=Mycobacterium rhizamassiliense TaxID=1841860 RepID=UPI00097D60C9|nr:hydroxysqualene dehydroxylase HpnE [Mycobacterium rhizamassiliense]